MVIKNGVHLFLQALILVLFLSCGETLSSKNEQGGTGLGANGSSFQGSDFNMAQIFSLRDSSVDKLGDISHLCQTPLDIFQKIDNRVSPSLGQTLCGRTLSVPSHQIPVQQTYAAVELLFHGSSILYPTEPRPSDDIEGLKFACRFKLTQQSHQYFFDYLFYDQEATLIISQFTQEGRGPRGPLDIPPRASGDSAPEQDEGNERPSPTFTTGTGSSSASGGAGGFSFGRTDQWIYAYSEVIKNIPFQSDNSESRSFSSSHRDFAFQITSSGELTSSYSLEALGDLNFNSENFHTIELSQDHLSEVSGECWHE